MKTELFYIYNTGIRRKMINLSGKNSLGDKRFYILPDRQMSFVKIFDLPPVAEDQLRDIVRFQMIKIYPGHREDISSDFIPFKTESGWRIVLYALKKKYMEDLLVNDKFEGVVLPVQLVSPKVLRKLSSLIVYYPDMVEVWNMGKGVPYKVERHEHLEFESASLPDRVNASKDSMVIYPEGRNPGLENRNGTSFGFSGILGLSKKYAVAFSEYRRKNRDRLTPPLLASAFVLSLILLVLSAARFRDFEVAEAFVNKQIEGIRLEVVQNREALDAIEKLEDELKQTRANVPVNIYQLLLRTDNVIDPDTTVVLFGLKGNEFSLTLESRNALSDIEGLKNEFGSIRVSKIRTQADGLENFTLWVGVN